MNYQLNRREFIRNTAVLGGTLATLRSPAILDAASPGDRIVLAVMGGGRGSSLASGFAALTGAEVKYVCDVDDARIAAMQKELGGKQAKGATPVKDLRRTLDDRDVDAVVIAAPDHWHAPATIMALAAGKHVYVEKPLSHNPREGELAVAAAKRFERVVQHGTQRRSWPAVIEAMEKVRSGELGKVRFSRGWYNNTRGTIGRGKLVPVPAGLDFALWQGPAPERPYQDNVIHYNWHWFWHWGTGELGNNGVHALDLCRWGLGVDYPRRITSGGGRYHFDDDQETPDTHVVTYDFGDKAITWEGRSCHPRGFEGSQFGAAFYGDSATLVTDGNGYTIFDLKGKEVKKATGSGSDAPHLQNFLDCIRGGKKPNAGVEEAHKSTLLCHLGNIAQRTGHVVNFDAQKQQILGDREAQALWGRDYNPRWEPKV